MTSEQTKQELRALAAGGIFSFGNNENNETLVKHAFEGLVEKIINTDESSDCQKWLTQTNKKDEFQTYFDTYFDNDELFKMRVRTLVAFFLFNAATRTAEKLSGFRVLMSFRKYALHTFLTVLSINKIHYRFQNEAYQADVSNLEKNEEVANVVKQHMRQLDKVRQLVRLYALQDLKFRQTLSDHYKPDRSIVEGKVAIA